MADRIRLIDGCGYGVPPTINGIVVALQGDTSYVSTPWEEVVATFDEENNEVDVSLYGDHHDSIYLDSMTIYDAASIILEYMKMA